MSAGPDLARPPGLGLPGCPVFVGPSTIPGAGRGVFARRDLPAGAVVGEYVGLQVRDTRAVREIVRARADYGYSPDDGSPTIYPDPFLDRSPPRGAQVPQLCNDAIHPEVTGRENNADFRERGGRVYVALTRAVRAGEEILLGYGYRYWRSRGRPAAIREHPAVVAAAVLDESVADLAVHGMGTCERVPGTDYTFWSYDETTRPVRCPVCGERHSASLLGVVAAPGRWWVACGDVEDGVEVRFKHP